MFINSIRRFPSMVFPGLLRERTVPPVAEKLSASKSTNIVASPAIPSNFACRRASSSQKMYLSVNLPRDVQSGAVPRVCGPGYVLPARRDGTGGCRDSVQKSSANEEILKLRRELSLTILGSIIAGLNAVITSLVRGTAPDDCSGYTLDNF